MKANCLSYCKETGKCNSYEGICKNKNMNNLKCETNGVCIEGYQKPQDYLHNRAGGEWSVMSDIIKQLSNRSGECVKMSCRHYLDTISGENDGSYCGKYEDKPKVCNHVNTINRSPEVFDMMLEALIMYCQNESLKDLKRHTGMYHVFVRAIQKATGKPW